MEQTRNSAALASLHRSCFQFDGTSSYSLRGLAQYVLLIRRREAKCPRGNCWAKQSKTRDCRHFFFTVAPSIRSLASTETLLLLIAVSPFQDKMLMFTTKAKWAEKWKHSCWTHLHAMGHCAHSGYCRDECQRECTGSRHQQNESRGRDGRGPSHHRSMQ